MADAVRAEMIDAVSITGGHLGSGLGVVELTVALHHVFDTPDDRIVWDVGHQCYPHKILTERRDRIRRAAALAEALVHAAGPDPIEVHHPRPNTVAGIAVVRARRIQLRKAGTP